MISNTKSIKLVEVKICPKCEQVENLNSFQNHVCQTEIIPCELCEQFIIINEYDQHIAQHCSEGQVSKIIGHPQKQQIKDFHQPDNGQQIFKQNQVCEGDRIENLQYQKQKMKKYRSGSEKNIYRNEKKLLQQQQRQQQQQQRQNQSNNHPYRQQQQPGLQQLQRQQQYGFQNIGQFRNTPDNQILRMNDAQIYEYFTELDKQISKGLDENTFAHLNEYQNSNTQGDECTICKSEMEQNENLITLPCIHNFHATCIKQWLQYRKTCPICQREVEI